MRYLATADLGTNRYLAPWCRKSAKLRGVAGANKKPLAVARCRSMMV